MRIATWNVNGIRAREDEFLAWINREKPDALCLQEIKAAPDQLSLLLSKVPGYTSFWHGAKGGYSGVALHLRSDTFPQAREASFSHPSFDLESRIVQVDLGHLIIASVYVPNGGKDFPAKMVFLEAMVAYAAELKASGKQAIICGDMNVALEDRDVYPSQRKAGSIGQKPEERELFEKMLAAGLTDLGRKMHPDDDRLYTWWPYWRQSKEKNLGWRLDYLLATADLASRATSHDVERMYGTSDHAPVTVTFID